MQVCRVAERNIGAGQLLINPRSMTDRTVLIVTHRPRVREVCDRVWEAGGYSVEHLFSAE